MQYLGCIVASLNSNFACASRCTHVIFLPVGPRKSLVMIIKLIWKLNVFLSSQKALTSNFHVFFLGGLVFNLRFGRTSCQHPQISNMK